MDPKERLEKAKKLVDAFKDLDLDDTEDPIFVLRLFVQALAPRLIIRDYPHD